MVRQKRGVGANLVDTMSALYTRVQLFEDLDVLDDDGEPLSGMKIPFRENLSGAARLAVMAHTIVDQCTAAIEPVEGKVPLLLCCPEASAFGLDNWPAGLLDEVIAQAGLPIDRRRSRVFPGGRDAVPEALGAALALLKEPTVPTCLVGGVDCLIDEGRLHSLLKANRLITAKNKDGFIAGEAGVMLALTTRPGPDALATWLAAVGGNDEACRGRDRPVTGAGLQEAMTRALALANLRFDDLACLAHDFLFDWQGKPMKEVKPRLFASAPDGGTTTLPTGRKHDLVCEIAMMTIEVAHPRPGRQTFPKLVLESSDGGYRQQAKWPLRGRSQGPFGAWPLACVRPTWPSCPVREDYLRAFAQRDWVRVERVKMDFWARQYAQHGPAPSIRAARILRLRVLVHTRTSVSALRRKRSVRQRGSTKTSRSRRPDRRGASLRRVPLIALE